MGLPKAGEPFNPNEWGWAASEEEITKVKLKLELMKNPSLSHHIAKNGKALVMSGPTAFGVSEGGAFADVPEAPPVPAKFVGGGDTWKTKAGVLVYVKDMEDSHLQNSREMLKRGMKLLEAKMQGHKDALKKLDIEVTRRRDAKAAQLQRIAYEESQRRKTAAALKKEVRKQPTGRRFRED